MNAATQPLTIWKRANGYSQTPQTRCQPFLARNTLLSSHTRVFIIKPILLRTSGNQRPTAPRCHYLDNKPSGIFTSIFFLSICFNTMLELCYICNLESCLSAQHRRPQSSKVFVFNGCFTPFWGMVTYRATPWLVIIWRASNVLLFTEERCPRVRAGSSEHHSHSVPSYGLHTESALRAQSNRTNSFRPASTGMGHQAQQLRGAGAMNSGSHACCARSILRSTGCLQSSPFITALLCLFNKHSQSNPFILS